MSLRRRWRSASASTTVGTPSASASASACSASASPPEPTTQACTRPSATTISGCRRTHGVGGRAQVAHHPGQPGTRARGAQHRGAGVGLRAGADADDAAGVLVRERPPAPAAAPPRRPAAAPRPVPPAGRARCRRGAPLRTPAAAGSTRWAILWVPNVTVRSARTCRPVEPPGVDVDARRHVDRDDRHSRERGRAPPRPPSRRPGRPPMPTIPSTTTSGRWASATRHTTRPPAARSAASPSTCTCRDSSTASTAAPGARASRPPTARRRRCRRPRPAAAPGRA